jgi:hypothetical protein
VAANQSRFGFVKEEAPAFWQARFYDFNVYSAGKKSEKLNYMHANPVIRKEPAGCRRYNNAKEDVAVSLNFFPFCHRPRKFKLPHPATS